jgi:O-antigen ligase
MPPLMSYHMQVAVLLATISIFVAPFRASAGLRASALLVALLLLIFLWWKTRVRTIEFPKGVLFRASVLTWVAVVFFYSLIGPNWSLSLVSWRGDVITPLLAGIVFYSLGRSPRIVAIWLVALLVGLLVLTAMLLIEPFQPGIATYAPRHVNVGWLSTWLVMLASLLPLAWLLRWPKPRLALWLAALATCVVVAAAWLTVNRVVWLCFGVMFLAYLTMNKRNGGLKSSARIAAFVLCPILSVGLFYASSTARAAYYPEAENGVVGMLRQDDRYLIWEAAVRTIAERPFTGYGFATEEAKNALSMRFAEPWFREHFKQAHNFVLNAAIQMGIPGAIAVLVLFAGIGYGFLCRRHVSPQVCAVAACGVALVGGVFLRNMTDDFFSRHAALLFGALVGMLFAICDWRDPTMYAKALETTSQRLRDAEDTAA